MTGDRPPTPSRIFISYRRSDSERYVLALAQDLKKHFGKQIFPDDDAIRPGEDFVEALKRQLGASTHVLVIIGNSWLSATDARGRRRLDDPHDYLRLEIATALRGGVVVVPVLIGAGLPAADELPADLRPLAALSGLELRPASWKSDVIRLIHAIERRADPESDGLLSVAPRWATVDESQAVRGAARAGASRIFISYQEGDAPWA